MKRWICGVLLTLGAYGSAFSQVVDMQKLESDSPKLEQRQDLNGEPCAVIKVVTDDNSMTFDGNVIGAPLRKGNALFVYMTGGSKQLRIKSSKTTPFMLNFDKFGINGLVAGSIYQVTFSVEPKADEEIFQLDKTFKSYQLIGLRDSIPFEKLKSMADRGDVDAQAEVAACYYLGVVIGKNGQKMLEYARKAASKDNPEALSLLGVAYEEGLGTKKNLAKSAEWYQKAVKLKYPVAMCNLGYMYEKGTGVPVNPTKALQLYQEALQLGWSDACFDLYTYYTEQGTEPNAEKALEYLTKGARCGSSICQAQLGLCYLTGGNGDNVVVPKDYGKAFRLFTLSALKNDVDGMALLGQCYYDGHGTTRDFSKAFYWLRMAAEKNDGYSQYLVGCCFLDGLGVTKSLIEAKAWLQRAADNGIENAAELLKKI